MLAPALLAVLAKDFPTSEAQYEALKAAAKGTAPAPRQWTGIWTRSLERPPFFTFGDNTQQNPELPFGYGRSTAVLTPEYQAKFDKKVADLKKGIEWDQLSDCLPAGFPRWLTEPFLREFIVTPPETWMITEQQSEVRRIYTDGRGRVPADEAYPLWEGDSIGFRSGDTLVIHTNNLKPGQYQRGQPDHSDQTSAVELARQVSPNLIEIRIVVYDPKSLQKPYRATFTYDRAPEPLWINMWSCNENNNVVKTGSGASDFVLPGSRGTKTQTISGSPPGNRNRLNISEAGAGWSEVLSQRLRAPSGLAWPTGQRERHKSSRSPGERRLRTATEGAKVVGTAEDGTLT